MGVDVKLSDKIMAFDLVARIYDDWYSHPQGRQIFEAELNAINLHIPKIGLGLELGAGTGIFAKHLTSMKRVIICLDHSKEMLKIAFNRGVNSILGVGEALPLRVGVLDFTYMITVIEFLDDPVIIFNEIQKTLKKNARLTVLFINSESSWGALYRDIGLKGDPVFKHAKFYNMDQVEEFFKLTNYCIIKKAGTLTTSPIDKTVGGEITKPSNKNGVIILTALIHKF